jgi:methylmalonyl-CoA/ethylmalonyl-CoA epimerase
MIKKFHHAGIAVKDLEKAISSFGKIFGTRLIWRAVYEDQKFETALVGNGDLRFELLASLGSESFITKFIENRGEGIHHISIEVDQFDHVIEDFMAKGLKVMGETDTEDFKATFIHPQSNLGVLTEIIEPKGGWGS